MIRTPPLAKLRAAVGCFAAVALSGAVHAKAEIIKLGSVDPEGMISEPADCRKNETLAFKSKIDKSYDLDIAETADGQDLRIPPALDKTCGFDKFHETFIAFSDKGTLDLDIATWATVPEPATWVMILAGLGGMGAALRSRRKSTLSAD